MDPTGEIARRRRDYYFHALRYFECHYGGNKDLFALLKRAAANTLDEEDYPHLSLVRYIMLEVQARKRSQALSCLAKKL